MGLLSATVIAEDCIFPWDADAYGTSFMVVWFRKIKKKYKTTPPELQSRFNSCSR